MHNSPFYRFIFFLFICSFILLITYQGTRFLTKLKEGSPTCVVHVQSEYVQSDKIMPGPDMNDSKCPTITENVHKELCGQGLVVQEWMNKENQSDFNSPIEMNKPHMDKVD